MLFVHPRRGRSSPPHRRLSLPCLRLLRQPLCRRDRPGRCDVRTTSLRVESPHATSRRISAVGSRPSPVRVLQDCVRWGMVPSRHPARLSNSLPCRLLAVRPWHGSRRSLSHKSPTSNFLSMPSAARRREGPSRLPTTCASTSSAKPPRGVHVPAEQVVPCAPVVVVGRAWLLFPRRWSLASGRGGLLRKGRARPRMFSVVARPVNSAANGSTPAAWAMMTMAVDGAAARPGIARG